MQIDVFFHSYMFQHIQATVTICHLYATDQTHQHDKTPVQNASVISEMACRAQHRLLQPVATVRTEVKQ